MNINPFGPYYAGALRAAIASCFINGRVSEQQIDFAKEVILKFREVEIEQVLLFISWLSLELIGSVDKASMVLIGCELTSFLFI